MTVNCFTALPPAEIASPHLKYKKFGILGGSEVATVYVVHVDEAFGDGKVNRQSNVSPDHQYAMKIFQGTTPELEYRIRNEIGALQKLSHRNVVDIHESFLDHGQVHMIMNLCTGGTLASKLPYSEQDALNVVRKLLSGVKYLHDQGIVHSALSMETILYDDEGDEGAEIKIVNFGVARKYLNESRFTSEEEDHALYAASPESFRGVHTKKGDMWSIGVIAYYLLSGLKPFRGERWLEKLYNGEILYAPEAWSTISSEAKIFVSSLLNPDISKRPDASKAMSYRWIFMASIPRIFRSIGAAPDDGVQGIDACIHRRGEEFKRVVMNVSACLFFVREREPNLYFVKANTSNVGNGRTTRRRSNS